MAQGADWILQSASVLWIFTLLLSESQSKKTQVYYMDGSDCDNRKILGGAMVYSQNSADSSVYSAGLECQMVFKAEREGWRLMMRLIELDIPDRTPSGICNDALYIYDDRTHYTRAMEEAGGNAGLCGSKLPPTLYSTDQYLTVHFRTDQSGPAGRGFKFIITAISEDFRNRQTCGNAFQCDNSWCIDEELMCDNVNHCGDYSDEAADGRAKCQQGQDGSGLISKFLSLGVTASIAITVGSIVIVVACIVALVCCCRRSFCKKPQDHSAVTTTTTTVVSNGAPPSNYQGVNYCHL